MLGGCAKCGGATITATLLARRQMVYNMPAYEPAIGTPKVPSDMHFATQMSGAYVTDIAATPRRISAYASPHPCETSGGVVIGLPAQTRPSRRLSAIQRRFACRRARSTTPVSRYGEVALYTVHTGIREEITGRRQINANIIWR